MPRDRNSSKGMTMTIDPETSHPGSTNRSIVPLAMAMLLASTGVSITTVALPALARDFSVDVTQAQWAVLGYLLAVTVSIVTCGRLGDMVGHRPVFLAGLAIFATASALCAAAPTLGLLVVFRALQGVGGAILMALPISIARDVVAKERVGRAMGLLGTTSAVGTALGPSMGGLIIAWSGWQATFLTLAVLALAVLVVAVRTLPAARVRPAGARPGLDLAGMLVLALTLTAYSLAVTGGGGFPVQAALLLAAAVAGAIVFVVVEKRSAMPLVALDALRARSTAASLAMNLLVSSVMMSVLVVGPFYLAFGLQLNDALVGLVLAVGPAMAALTGVPAGYVTDRFGARPVLMFSLVHMMIALVCISTLPGMFGIAGFVLSLMALTPSFQLFLAANNTEVMLAARDDQRGMISGLLGLSRNLGLMTGASVMGAVFAIAAGSADITRTAPETVGFAFSVTFQVAAGVVAFAFVLALAGRRTPSRAQQDDLCADC